MDLRTAETTLEFAEEASAAATGPDAKVALERLETRVDDVLAAMDRFRGYWSVSVGCGS